MVQVKLHAEKFENLIARRGRLVKWQEAVICSCMTDTGHPQSSCLACHGKGFTYNAPSEGVVIVQSVTQNKDFEDMAGVFEVGDAVMSVPKRVVQKNPATGLWDMTMKSATVHPMFEIGMYDLVTLLDDEYKTSEVLQKGTPMYGRPADTMLNEDVTKVKLVRTVAPATGAVTVYSQGADYKLTGNKIEWQAGGASPLDGEYYSVVYYHRPVYTVFSTLPKPRHQDGQDLPRYVALRYRAGGVGQ